MDLSKAPKQFCDNITSAYSQEFFILALFNGESGAAYSLTPQHMKRLSQYLANQITEYERKFGAINAEWKPGIESPIQTKDILGEQDKK